jgi:hypothetical protein
MFAVLLAIGVVLLSPRACRFLRSLPKSAPFAELIVLSEFDYVGYLHCAMAPAANSSPVILDDLLLGELRHVLPLIPSAIPGHRPLQRLFDS